MLKVSHIKLVAFSGLLWLGIGLFLLPLGLNFLIEAGQDSSARHPILDSIAPFFGGIEPATVVVIACGLFLGYFKGRFVLGKSVNRLVVRIQTFPNPTSFFNLYPMKYYFLLGSMIGLGMLIKYLDLALDVRGAVDVVIGSALINGAMIYFRFAFALRENYL